MKKLFFAFILLLLIVGGALTFIYIKGQSIMSEGELNTRWIRLEMWAPPYFNKTYGNLTKEDEVFLEAVSGKPIKGEVREFLAENSCRDMSEKCTSNLLAVVGVLLSEGELDRALGLINQSARNIENNKVCPVKFELVLLRNVAEVMKRESISEARSRARQAIKVLKDSKGINFNMQSSACNEMAKNKPELFHHYVMQVSEIMSYAGGSLAESAAYLRKVNQLN